ncbi:DUF4403 family protein [Pontibacter cellulosilyticus]|uniref:DUF4403 family protein n=1 Tax=Pontibacter cellulosilyticus TaxID=1720253 RepID=A0A923N701_9BACT|nr:DUF4403 family protein [Pontibacter cellulosilyticus]MBC5992581.1 DUF4403 family protein [Pontibacter cellulosilyticus]
MDNAIRIQLPVSVTYHAIEEVLKKQLIGEFIPKPEAGTDEAPYAQLLDVGIVKSSAIANEVVLAIKIKILRTMLKRDQVELFVQATLDYDQANEQLYVQQFNLQSRTSSGLYNTALEVLANKVAYNQILKKARIDLREIISKELGKANSTLDEGLVLKGIKLKGTVETVRIHEVNLLPNRLLLLLEVQGNLEADIHDLLSLLPAQ